MEPRLPTSLLGLIAQFACSGILSASDDLQGTTTVASPSITAAATAADSIASRNAVQLRDNSSGTLTARQIQFLQRFDQNDENDYDDDDDDDYVNDDDSGDSQELGETREQFEEKKRKLMLLLDQAQIAKMKITRAFPQRLAEFGPDVDTIRRKYGIHHAAWNEPERYIPDIDCDPYRGACSVSSCPCDLFESWPRQVGTKTTFIYNPDSTNPETELCHGCHHAKVDHTIKPGKDRDKIAEFSRDNVEKYSIQHKPGIPRRHPVDIPWYELKKFYEQNPTYPGASEEAVKISLVDIEESKKPKSLAEVMNTSESYGDDDDEDLEL